jgi:hypothetical protein
VAFANVTVRLGNRAVDRLEELGDALVCADEDVEQVKDVGLPIGWYQRQQPRQLDGKGSGG